MSGTNSIAHVSENDLTVQELAEKIGELMMNENGVYIPSMLVVRPEYLMQACLVLNTMVEMNNTDSNILFRYRLNLIPVPQLEYPVKWMIIATKGDKA